jgi:aryl-alcohol dehydrogenase-like predicted oxidoreductase
MEYRKIGGTDLEVSTVAMGCWAIVGDTTWGRQDENDSAATIKAALDSGVNFFDTAEAYGHGHSEELLGKVLRGHRQEAVIATKASPSNHAPLRLRKSCEGSLTRLRTDYIDLYQLHWPGRGTPFKETMAALRELKKEGKIREIGVSNFGNADLDELLPFGRPATNQMPYNLLWRAIEYEVSGKCVENDIGLLPYSPLAQGLLTGKFGSPDEVPEGRARTRHFSRDRQLVRHGEEGCESEVFEALSRIRAICEEVKVPMADAALAWLLRQSGVVSVLAGARKPEQILENARASELEMSDETTAALAAATDTVKERLGPNVDMWQSAADSRIR